MLFRSTSDIRLKDDVSTITNALNKTLQLRGVNYSMLNEKTGIKDYNIGVIAQELKKVLPELVHEGESGKLSVSYGTKTYEHEMTRFLLFQSYNFRIRHITDESN